MYNFIKFICTTNVLQKNVLVSICVICDITFRTLKASDHPCFAGIDIENLFTYKE